MEKREMLEGADVLAFRPWSGSVDEYARGDTLVIADALFDYLQRAKENR